MRITSSSGNPTCCCARAPPATRIPQNKSTPQSRRGLFGFSTTSTSLRPLCLCGEILLFSAVVIGGSEEEREAGVEGGDGREVAARIPRGGVGQVVALLVRGGEEVAAHFGGEAPALAEVEAEAAAHLRRRLGGVAPLEISARAR